jgi:hypothetical protein
MREKKPQQIGNYLLTKKTPKQLKADMNENNHELSDLIIDDPSWESFAWNGVILTSPLMALRGAESLKYLPDGTVIVEPFPRNPDGNLVYKNAKGLYDNKAIRIADIVNQVNKKLLELGKKTITDQSVLSNLKKAAKYLHTAYNLVLRPDSTHMTVTLLNADATDKEIAKWYNQMESRLEKIITLAQHAKNSDFKELKSLPKAQQKFLRCNEAFKLQTGNENE